MRTLEHREFKKFAQGHTDSKWQIKYPNKSALTSTPETMLWTIHYMAFYCIKFYYLSTQLLYSGNWSRAKKKKKILIMNNVICKKIYCIVLCVIGSNPNVQIGAQLSKWYMSR